MILLDKIKQFIDKLFRKEDKKMLNSPQKAENIEKMEEVNKVESVAEVSSTLTLDDMRKEREAARKKDEIINMLINNPDAVDNLPEGRLIELEKMCVEKFEENDKKLNELKQKHERMKAKLG